MPDVSGTYIRGLLLAQPIEPWVAQSSYTERSPVADLVAKGRSTYGVLVAAGVPDGTASLQVRCQHGGTPGQIDHGPTVATRRVGETLYLGHEPEGTVSTWEPLTYTAISNEEDPAIATLYDDSVVVVARRGATLLSWTRTPAGVWGAAVTVYNDDPVVYYPCLLTIGEELYLIAWRRGFRDLSGDSAYYLTVWRTLDSGATWEIVQDYATVEADVRGGTCPFTGTGSEYYVGQIRAAYRDGEVIVLSGLTRNYSAATPGDAEYVRQWGGASLTARLDLVATNQDGGGIGLPDVVAVPAGFLALTLGRSTGHVARLLGSAYQPLTTATSYTARAAVAANYYQPAVAVFALSVDQGQCMATDGTAIAIAWVTAGDSNIAKAMYSPDGGVTWRSMHSTDPLGFLSTPGSWWYNAYDNAAGARQNAPRQLAACMQRGRVAIAHDWRATIDTKDDSIAVAWLGGWSDLTLPYEDEGVHIGQRVGWRHNWLPYERPDDQDYTMVTAGTSASTLVVDDGEWEVTTGDGAGAVGNHYAQWRGAVPATAPQVGVVEWETRLTTDGATVTCDVGVTVRLAAVNHGVEVEVNVDQAQVGVRDLVSGLPLAGSPFGGFVLGTRYQWRLGLAMASDTGAGRELQIWYRVQDDSEERRWTRLGSWTLTDDGGVGNDPYTGAPFPRVPQLRFGNIASSGNVTQRVSRWRKMQWNLPDSAAVICRAGSRATWHDLNQTGGDNPGKLPGRPLGSALQWATGDFVIAGRGGPFLIADTFIAAVTGEFALSQATSLEAPTPRWYWEAKTDTAAETIAWPSDPDQPGTEDNAHPPVMGLYLGGINFRRALLYSRTAAGVDTLRATIDTRVLSGVGYARKGRRIEPSGAASTVYMTADEAAGYTAEWDDGAGTTVRRKVAGNDAGRWNSAAADPVLRIELESTTAADPTSGGTFSLWSSDVLVVLQGRDCAGWKLVIDNTYPTADGQYRIGSLLWGPMHVFGLDYAWGRSIELEAGHEYQTIEGKAPIRIDRGPATRLVRIAWEDGVDETEIRETSATNWVSAEAGADPAASRAATLHNLQGALRRHAGRPVVLATSIVRATGLPQILKRHDQRMLSTIPGGLVLETMLGDENATEVARGGTLELVEVR